MYLSVSAILLYLMALHCSVFQMVKKAIVCSFFIICKKKKKVLDLLFYTDFHSVSLTLAFVQFLVEITARIYSQ